MEIKKSSTNEYIYQKRIQKNGDLSQSGALFGRPVQKIDSQLSSFIKELPQDGFDLGEFLFLQPRIPYWNEDMELSADKLTLSHMTALVARLVATVTLGRMFCYVGAFYHVIAGTSKLIIAVSESKIETKEKTAAIFKNAINHFFLAVYNGVAAFRSVNYFIATTYALVPQWVEEQHLKFAGTDYPIDFETREFIHKKRKEFEKLNRPQLYRIIGACIDVERPYDQSGLPAPIQEDENVSSFIRQKCEEIAKQRWFDEVIEEICCNKQDLI